MNRRFLAILIIALIIATACAFLVYRVIGNRQVAARPVETTRVIAAAGDIKLGSVLNASNLTIIEIAGTLPEGALLKPENAIGRGVISDLYRGEPILESRLAAPGSGGAPHCRLPHPPARGRATRPGPVGCNAGGNGFGGGYRGSPVDR